jgi:hypothetical protein
MGVVSGGCLYTQMPVITPYFEVLRLFDAFS